MRDSLSLTLLRRLARRLCGDLRLPVPADEALAALYADEIPQPILLNNGEMTLWIDRYYAAYQKGGGAVRYVYLTRTHVSEEREAYEQVGLPLPADIEEAFRAAGNREITVRNRIL